MPTFDTSVDGEHPRRAGQPFTPVGNKMTTQSSIKANGLGNDVTANLIRCLRISVFFGLLLLFCGNAIAEGKRVALVIGNSKYKAGGYLDNPANDAALLRKRLKDCGFEIVQENDSDNLSHAKMLELLVKFHDRIADGGTALFYYAGHGVQVADKNYLVPVDAKLSRELEVYSNCVSMESVYGAMAKGGTVNAPKAATNIIFLDCCRDYPFARRWSRGAKQGLAPEDPPDGCIMSFAAKHGQVAIDGRDHSPYSEALAKHILTKGIDIQSMLTRVAKDVFTETGHKQRTEQRGDLVDLFFFVPGNNHDESLAVGPVQKTVPTKTEEETPSPSLANTSQPTSANNSTNGAIDTVQHIIDANSDNRSDAFFPYLSFPVENWDGTKHADQSHIERERRQYIRKWPQREFQLTAAPVVTGHLANGDYLVLTKTKFTVSNPQTGQKRPGTSTITWSVRHMTDGTFKIVSMKEVAVTEKQTSKKAERQRAKRRSH